MDEEVIGVAVESRAVRAARLGRELAVLAAELELLAVWGGGAGSPSGTP